MTSNWRQKRCAPSMPQLPLFSNLEIRVAWNGNPEDIVKLRISIEVECTPNLKLKLLDTRRHSLSVLASSSFFIQPRDGRWGQPLNPPNSPLFGFASQNSGFDGYSVSNDEVLIDSDDSSAGPSSALSTVSPDVDRTDSEPGQLNGQEVNRQNSGPSKLVESSPTLFPDPFAVYVNAPKHKITNSVQHSRKRSATAASLVDTVARGPKPQRLRYSPTREPGTNCHTDDGRKSNKAGEPRAVSNQAAVSSQFFIVPSGDQTPQSLPAVRPCRKSVGRSRMQRAWESVPAFEPEANPAMAASIPMFEGTETVCDQVQTRPEFIPSAMEDDLYEGDMDLGSNCVFGVNSEAKSSPSIEDAKLERASNDRVACKTTSPNQSDDSEGSTICPDEEANLFPVTGANLFLDGVADYDDMPGPSDPTRSTSKNQLLDLEYMEEDAISDTGDEAEYSAYIESELSYERSTIDPHLLAKPRVDMNEDDLQAKPQINIEENGFLILNTSAETPPGIYRVVVVVTCLLAKGRLKDWFKLSVPGLPTLGSDELGLFLFDLPEDQGLEFRTTIFSRHGLVENCLVAEFADSANFAVPLRLCDRQYYGILNHFAVDYQIRMEQGHTATSHKSTPAVGDPCLPVRYTSFCLLNTHNRFIWAKKCCFVLDIDGGPEGCYRCELGAQRPPVRMIQLETNRSTKLGSSRIQLICSPNKLELFGISWEVFLHQNTEKNWLPLIYPATSEAPRQERRDYLRQMHYATEGFALKNGTVEGKEVAAQGCSPSGHVELDSNGDTNDKAQLSWLTEFFRLIALLVMSVISAIFMLPPFSDPSTMVLFEEFLAQSTFVRRHFKLREPSGGKLRIRISRLLLYYGVVITLLFLGVLAYYMLPDTALWIRLLNPSRTPEPTTLDIRANFLQGTQTCAAVQYPHYASCSSHPSNFGSYASQPLEYYNSVGNRKSNEDCHLYLVFNQWNEGQLGRSDSLDCFDPLVGEDAELRLKDGINDVHGSNFERSGVQQEASKERNAPRASCHADFSPGDELYENSDKQDDPLKKSNLAPNRVRPSELSLRDRIDYFLGWTGPIGEH